MKIFLLNAQYGFGMNGSLKEYLFYGYRYLYCPKRLLDKNFAKIKHLILREKPDLVCLLEVRNNLIDHLLTSELFSVVIDGKYGKDSLLNKLPIFKGNSDAVLSRQKILIKKHYFKHGFKKIFYEVALLNGFTLFIAHFALGPRVRKKQFLQIRNLAENRKSVIICGDFNIFKGCGELDVLLKDGHLKLLNSEQDNTFPAVKPERRLDLFLSSEDVKVRNFKVLKDVVSDHLPLILEI